MRDVILELFGSYSPIVDSEGVPLQGVASLDFPWIVGAVVFVVCLWGVIRGLLRVLGS